VKNITHKSWCHFRLSYRYCRDTEKAFALAWMKENEGHSNLLQGLHMIGVPDLFWHPQTPVKVINGRDAMIAATVIQWLGTNVGMSFIEETLKTCGYKVSYHGERSFTSIPQDDEARRLKYFDGLVVDVKLNREQYKTMLQLRAQGLIVVVGKLTIGATGETGKFRVRLTIKGRERVEEIATRVQRIERHILNQRDSRRSPK